MKAIILAAGRGSRMGRLTNNNPKCLVEVNGRSLLDWQITAIKNADIKDISLVKGFLAERIQRDNVLFFYNKRWNETNMVRSLMCADEWLSNDTCIVSYSDIIYSTEVIKRLRSCNGDIVISYDINWRSLWESRFGDPLTDAETFRLSKDGKLVDIGRKPTSYEEIEGQYMGLLKISPKGWNKIISLLSKLSDHEIDRLDMTKLLLLLLDERISISTIGVEEKWFEIDSELDLIKCNTYFM